MEFLPLDMFMVFRCAEVLALSALFSLLTPNASVARKYFLLFPAVLRDVAFLHRPEAPTHYGTPVCLGSASGLTAWKSAPVEFLRRNINTVAAKRSLRGSVVVTKRTRNALVGEFMVGFLLVFTVLRTAVYSDFFICRWHALQQHVCVRWCHHLCQAPRFVRFHVVRTETCRTILYCVHSSF